MIDKLQFEHSMLELLGFEPKSPAARAIKKYGITLYSELVALCEEEDLGTLSYDVSVKDPKTNLEIIEERGLTKLDKLKLKSFARVNAYFATHFQFIPEMGNDEFDIREVTYGMYKGILQDSSLIPIQRRSQDSSSIAVPKLHPNAPPAALKDPLADFKKTIKRDTRSFPVFKQDHLFESWFAQSLATARAQDVADVFDINFIPQVGDPARLFRLKNDFVYSAFSLCVLTSKGKAIVFQHAGTSDAQKVVEHLLKHYRKSTLGKQFGLNIFDYLTTVKVGDGSWRGDLHTFVTHWSQQARLFNDTKEQNDPTRINEDQLFQYLERSVRPLAELRSVKQTADQVARANGVPLDFETYVDLLLEAASSYDIDQKSKSASSRRLRVNEAFIADHLEGYGETYLDHKLEVAEVEPYNVETPVTTILANAAQRSSRSSPARAPDPASRLPNEIFSQLGQEGRRAWAQMPVEARALLVRYCNPNSNPSPSPVHANQHAMIPLSGVHPPPPFDRMGSIYAQQHLTAAPQHVDYPGHSPYQPQLPTHFGAAPPFAAPPYGNVPAPAPPPAPNDYSTFLINAAMTGQPPSLASPTGYQSAHQHPVLRQLILVTCPG